MVRVHKDDFKNAANSPSLHPIIRKFSRGRFICEHHVIEDIESEWLEDVHVTPLMEFFTQHLSRDRSKALQILNI
ncbi:MAG: hypothetical protein AAF349_09235 [Cyanobacteria bacterium P01_A01_bin.68]